MTSNNTKQSVDAEMSSVDKKDIVHLETTSMDSQTKEEVRQVTNLTAKEQYAKLGAAIKADKRFVWWTFYVMLLVFSWGYDAGLSGVAIAFPSFSLTQALNGSTQALVNGPWCARVRCGRLGLEDWRCSDGKRGVPRCQPSLAEVLGGAMCDCFTSRPEVYKRHPTLYLTNRRKREPADLHHQPAFTHSPRA